MVSCKRTATYNHKKGILVTKEDTTPVNINIIKKQKNIPIEDLLSIEEAKIGKSKFYFKKKLLNELWGKPDSIKSFNVECGYLAEITNKAKKYYFNGVNMVIYNEEVGIEDVDFTITDKVVIFPEIILSRNTSLKEFQKFNNSYSNREEYIGQNKNTTLRFIAGKGLDLFIILDFVNEKLVFLSVWESC